MKIVLYVLGAILGLIGLKMMISDPVHGGFIGFFTLVAGLAMVIMGAIKVPAAKKDFQVECPNCQYKGAAKPYVRGNFAVEVVLWLFLLVPGLVYSVWRVSGGRQYKCPQCDFIHVKKLGFAQASQ